MSKFQFEETLEDTSLCEMFYTIFRHKMPGRMEVSREGVVKRIYISDGNVIHATSSDRSDRLGAHLYRIGKLSREQLVETMRQREQSGRRHGQILIEEGLIAPNELYAAIRSQMESIVWSVFSWQDGRVSFKIGEFEDPPTIKIHLPMRQVIVHGIKQIPDTKALVGKLGRKSTIFGPKYQTEDLIELALDAEEYALLRLVDGQRSLYSICTEGPYGVSENARLLYAFHVLQLVERLDDPQRPGTGPVTIRYSSSDPLQ